MCIFPLTGRDIPEDWLQTLVLDKPPVSERAAEMYSCPATGKPASAQTTAHS